MPTLTRFAAVSCVCVVAAALIAGCRGGADDSPAAPPPAAGGQASAPAPSPAVVTKVLAEATHQAGALTVQVIEAQRVTPDTVRVEIALINTSQAPAAAAAFNPADLCLVTPDGSRRLFVLRDATNAPRVGGSFEPLQAGERRLVWAIFPSPASDTSHVSLLLGGMILKDIPIAPAPSDTRAS